MMVRNAKRIEQIPTSARIRYIKTVSEYYDGVTSRRWDARTVSSDSALAGGPAQDREGCCGGVGMRRSQRQKMSGDCI